MVKLSEISTRAPKDLNRKKVEKGTNDLYKRIGELQELMQAGGKHSLLVVFQGMDSSGKDGLTKRVFRYCSPVGINAKGFRKPTDEEFGHDFLWRVHKHAPEKGMIQVFNRSHYEDVLVVKVRNFAPADKVEQRYEQINNFERHLSENGTKILKFMLHISHETQGERLKERLIMQRKMWKFNPGDLEDRKLWPEFMDAYETMVQRTSTPWAPWHVIPSDSRSRRGAIISSIVRKTLEDMAPAYPGPEYKLEDYEGRI